MPQATFCKSVCLQDKEEGLCPPADVYGTRRKDYFSSCCLQVCLLTYRIRWKDSAPQLLSASLSAYRIRRKKGLYPPAAVMLTGQGERTSICPQLLLSALCVG